MLTSGVACPRSREAKPGLHAITFTSTQFLILLSLLPPPQTSLLAARDVLAEDRQVNSPLKSSDGQKNQYELQVVLRRQERSDGTQS